MSAGRDGASSTGKPLRRDARRNREHILAVAREVFSEVGLDASLDAIAKRAGVGAGTLYRHFPDREALVAGVLEGAQPDLVQAHAAIIGADVDSGTALQDWLDAVVDWMRAYDGLSDPLRAAWSENTSPLAPTCEDVIGMTEVHLGAAQRDGHARPGIRGRDLYLFALGAAWAAQAPSADGGTERALRELLRAAWSRS